MSVQLDVRPTFIFTRLGRTLPICKAKLDIVNATSKRYITLKDNEDLDSIAQKYYQDQHEWRRIANANMKTILEFGIDFPFNKEICIP